MAAVPAEPLPAGPSPGQAAGAFPAAPIDPLFRKLGGILLFRLVLVTVLLGVTAVWQLRIGGAAPPLAAALYRIIIGTYALSLAYALWLRAGRGLRGLAWAQIATDVALATAVVGITGWSESVFVFMYSLAIVDGGILLFQGGAVGALALSLVGYVPLAVLASPVRPATLTLFAHAGAFVATAALASYLAEQVRRTGERLAARELDLAAITALHESIVQSVASGLLTVDGRGRVTFLNRAGEQITGLAAAEVRGRPAQRWFGAFQESQRGETDFTSARGERLHLGYTLFPLRGRHGEEIGRAVIFQDLTRLRAMEDRMQRSERLAEMGSMAAGLAHELRNPIAAISGSVELLRAGAGAPAGDARLMEIVVREATRLDQLVTRFLEYARPATPQRAPADLARIASETLEVFVHDPAASRVRVERELAAAPAHCDADQMRQVVWNLLLNAAQAVPAAGREERARVVVRTAPEAAGGALLEVEDDGPGIAPQDLPRLFTPFFTTKERGTGLGLATVQRIVDAHQGTIAASPGTRGGARFTVRLPPPPAAPG